MKIFSIRNINKYSKIILTAGALITSPVIATSQFKQKYNLQNDIVQLLSKDIPPQGSKNKLTLLLAPSPKVRIKGQEKIATIVVDLNKNYLYKYDSNGKAESVYLIASGKQTTPTSTGIRVVSHVENYPYKKAPKSTKRYKNPKDYGPRIIILNKIDPKTGKTNPIGEFIHGNNNAKSIGKYVSKGCMRMDNEVIKQLSSQVKRGDIVIIDKY